MLTEGSRCWSASDCSALLKKEDLGVMFDIVERFSNGTYLLGLNGTPGISYHIVNNKFHKPHFVYISSFKSDSINIQCPDKENFSECAYGWTPLFDYEKGMDQMNNMLGSMEERE